jgi:hypothetical protein
MATTYWPKGKKLPFGQKKVKNLLQQPQIKPVVKSNKKNGKR